MAASVKPSGTWRHSHDGRQAGGQGKLKGRQLQMFSSERRVEANSAGSPAG